MAAPTPPTLVALVGTDSDRPGAADEVNPRLVAERAEAMLAALKAYAQAVMAEAQALVATEATARSGAVAAASTAASSATGGEATARQNADTNLQSQITAILARLTAAGVP